MELEILMEQEASEMGIFRVFKGYVGFSQAGMGWRRKRAVQTEDRIWGKVILLKIIWLVESLVFFPVLLSMPKQSAKHSVGI